MFNIKQNYGCINIITVDQNNIFVEGINLLSIKDFRKEVWYGQETIKFRDILINTKTGNELKNSTKQNDKKVINLNIESTLKIR